MLDNFIILLESLLWLQILDVESDLDFEFRNSFKVPIAMYRHSRATKTSHELGRSLLHFETRLIHSKNV